MAIISAPFFLAAGGIVATLSSSQNDYNLRTDLINSYGWDGNSAISVRLFINSGVTIGSTSTSTAAFSTGTFPNGSIIQIINKGRIQGKGGTGGTGASSCCSGYQCALNNAGAGGNALQLSHNVLIFNTSGEIWGGGGGGGGGGSGADYYGYSAGGGGGGGGAGSQVGSGGTVITGGGGTDGNVGTAGTATAGGAGGTPVSYGSQTGAAGGAGGGPGLAGASGGAGNCPSGARPGGAAGKAINLNGYTATFSGNGDVRGSVA